MNLLISLLLICALPLSPSLMADQSTYLNDQKPDSYYCPTCASTPCSCAVPTPRCERRRSPCRRTSLPAPLCGTRCGVAKFAAAAAVAAVVVAGFIVLKFQD